MIYSPICKMLGIEYPIFQGGMAHISDAYLAAAVSNGIFSFKSFDFAKHKTTPIICIHSYYII